MRFVTHRGLWVGRVREVLAAGVVLVLAGFGWSDAVWVDREAIVMGARLKVELEANTEAEADRVIDRVFLEVAAFDEKWTALGPGSELADLRAAGLGDPVALSSETFDVLARAWHLADRTDGAFDPARVGRHCFDLSPATQTLARHCEDASIDNGGFGRGAALATIERILQEESITRARIDFGGQLLLMDPDASVEPVEILDPASDAVAFTWAAPAGSVATVRQMRAGTFTPGETEVIDPRSGAAVPAWGSVVVQSEDPFEADALASALFVMGPRDGIRWLAARPDVDALLIVSRAEGPVACGRTSILESLETQHPEAQVSTAPLLAEGLRTC